MPRNIEIKARIQGDFNKFLEVAKSLSDKEVVVLKQQDTFFHVPNGRLKLREQEGKENYLVFYDRIDHEGPKLSDYEICTVAEKSNVGSVLTRALGTLGVVRKIRTLCMMGQTRVHVDEVAELGNFVELEVVLRDDQTVEEGKKIANGLMKSLGIKEEDLLKGAYMDYILEKMASSS